MPEETVRIGTLWPIISGDYSCKKKWAWAGIRGSTSGVSCPEYEGCKRCLNKTKRLNYKWRRAKLWPFEK